MHCVALANDGLLYVCDRQGDRVQVFHTDGSYVKESLLATNTMGFRLDLGDRLLQGPAAEVPVHR